MPPIGLRVRLVVMLAGVLVAYGGIHTYFTARTQKDEILAEATLSTLRFANTIRRSTRYAMMQSRREDVHEIIEEIGQQEGIDHVRIFNKEGVIMYSARKAEIAKVVDRKAEACYQCHDAEQPLERLDTAKRARVFGTNGCRTLAAIDVIYNEPSCWTAACHAHPQSQSVLGVIDVGVSLAAADARVDDTTGKALIFGLVSTVLICALVGVFIYRFVNRPVRRMLECTRKIARGELDCCIPVQSRDELGELAQSFNHMTRDLGKARGELSTWAQKLEREVDIKTRDLRLAQAQILRSEKLSSLGMLAAGVAHELNSPLTGILTFAHLLLKRMPDDSSEREDLDVIVSETNRCAKIIRQLLDFSRETSPEKKPADLHAIVHQAVALVERQSLFHDIAIKGEFAPDLPAVPVDASQMQQVFLNLLMNAGEAMPQGGTLTVCTERVADATDPDAPERVRVVFRDTGVGIPAESIDKIFDPFFTSKDVGKGTGLGLAVTYGIIERHGGTIEVESTPGEGTTFSIHLPTAVPDPALEEAR